MSSRRTSTLHRRLRSAVSPKLERKLFAYAAVAGAVCTVTSLSVPSQAEVIYTSTNFIVPANTLGSFDINRDGVADFQYFNTNSYRFGRSTLTRYTYDGFGIFAQQASNQVVVVPGGNCAARLGANDTVGPSAPFAQVAGMFEIEGGGAGPCPGWNGLGKSGKLRGYIGLKFSFNGQTHYGWIRLISSFAQLGGRFTYLRVTGYAYESQPDTPIVTDERPNDESAVTPPASPVPASLGHLAAGASALKAWRP